MSNIGSFLAANFDAKLTKEVPISGGGIMQCWRIGNKILPVQIQADGLSTVYLPTMVENEEGLRTAIDDYLKGGYRVTIPISALQPKKR